MGKRAIGLLARAIFVAHAFAHNDHKILYFHNMPTDQYKPEGDDAVLLAKAILSKKVDGKKPSMTAWLTVDEEGQIYAHNNKFHTERGKRNIRTNCLKLYNKIAAWRSQEKDSSGHYVRFSDRFLKKAGFPDRPDLVGDIDPKVLSGFNPGRDEYYDTVINEERQEEVDSLTAYGEDDDEEFDSAQEQQQKEEKKKPPSYHDESDSEDEEEEEATTTNVVDFRHFDQLQMDPYAVKGQCPIAAALFKPVQCFAQTQSPDFDLNSNGIHCREMCMTRLKLPAGMDDERICLNINEKKDEMHISVTELAENFRGEVITGKKLMQAQPQMVGELCKVLQKTFRAANGTDQTKGLHYERYVIKLAKKLEPEFRNPFDNCRRVSASNCVHQVNIPGCNTIYLYIFNFVKQHDNNYDTAYDQRGKLGKETVVLNNNYASGNQSRSNKVRHIRSPFEKQTLVSDTESETETEESSNQQHYDYSTVTSFLRSNETFVTNDDDDSSIETMYDEFTVSHISIPVSSKSGLVSSSSFHTSRSSSSKTRGDHRSKNGSSKINIKRPTTTNPFRNGSLADPPGERRGGRRDDDDRSFQKSLTSDKSNKKKSRGWFY